MAYLNQIDGRCHETTCDAMAQVELFSHDGVILGRYCKTHGQKYLIREQQAEQTYFAAQQVEIAADLAARGVPTDRYDARGARVGEP